jgi:hypothetical protein
MRAIQPDTEYQIYTVRLAVPLHLGETAACDAINETLELCVGAPEDGNQYWLADYEIVPGETVLSDSDPDAALEPACADTSIPKIKGDMDDAVREALGLPRRRPFRTRQLVSRSCEPVTAGPPESEREAIAVSGR